MHPYPRDPHERSIQIETTPFRRHGTDKSIIQEKFLGIIVEIAVGVCEKVDFASQFSLYVIAGCIYLITQKVYRNLVKKHMIYGMSAESNKTTFNHSSCFIPAHNLCRNSLVADHGSKVGQNFFSSAG